MAGKLNVAFIEWVTIWIRKQVNITFTFVKTWATGGSSDDCWWSTINTTLADSEEQRSDKPHLLPVRFSSCFMMDWCDMSLTDRRQDRLMLTIGRPWPIHDINTRCLSSFIIGFITTLIHCCHYWYHGIDHWSNQLSDSWYHAHIGYLCWIRRPSPAVTQGKGKSS